MQIAIKVVVWRLEGIDFIFNLRCMKHSKRLSKKSPTEIYWFVRLSVEAVIMSIVVYLFVVTLSLFSK